jgi:hypothetical protein
VADIPTVAKRHFARSKLKSPEAQLAVDHGSLLHKGVFSPTRRQCPHSGTGANIANMSQSMSSGRIDLKTDSPGW